MGAPTAEPMAESKFHDIVPDGDVTLVLYNTQPSTKTGTEEKKDAKAGHGPRPMEGGPDQNGASASLFGRE